LVLLCGCPSTSFADSLFDAIQLAYDTNPGLRAQQAELRAVNEGYVQARAGYGPQVNLSGQVGYQAARVQEPASLFSRAATKGYQAATGSADLSVVQPIYTAGLNDARVRAAAAAINAGRETLRQSEGELILNVITAYSDVQRDRDTLRILRSEIAALQAEFDETTAKAALGALSKTDSAQAEARLLAALAQMNLALGRLNVSSAEYLNVVGQSPGELDPPPELPGMPDTPDQAFDAANQNNPQLMAAIDNERTAREQVRQARAEDGPSVSIRLDAAVTPTAPYLPRQYDQNLTAAVVFSQPLFTSGVNSSKIRQALEEDNRAEMNIEVARRGVAQLVSQAWSQLVAARTSIALQKRQVLAETTVAQGNRVEERAGIRSTIELLNAETELAGSQVSLVQGAHDEYVARAALLSAMGVLEVRWLNPGAQLYQPEASFNRVKGLYQPPWIAVVEDIDSVSPATGREPRMSPNGAGKQRPADLPPLPPSEQ
jgi:outer membrane protein